MNRSTCLLIVVAVGLVMLGACASRQPAGNTENETGEGDRIVSLDDVPAPVKATILREAGDNKIDEIKVESENGRTIYEVEWKADGEDAEIEVAPDGTLLEKEVGDGDDGEDEDDDEGDDDSDDDDNGDDDD